MSTPSMIIRKEQLAPDRSLRSGNLDEARHILRHGGLLLLPSDTCYSLAGSIHNERALDHITTILRRPNMPFSVTVRSIAAAERWVDIPDNVRRLLGEYTPGPITMICIAHKRHDAFTRDQIRSTDRTIGFRIPGSIIEREVTAALAEDEMITTTAVRDPQTAVSIREFAESFDIVRSGIDTLGSPIPWGAIEHDEFVRRDSLLVRYNHVPMTFDILPRPDSDDIARPGTYTFDQIRRILDQHAAQHSGAAP